MNKYVMTFNSIKNGDSLFIDYETIEGRTPKEALKSHFNKEFQRLTGDAGRYATVILVKGTYDKEKNNLHYSGRYQQLCFSEVS